MQKVIFLVVFLMFQAFAFEYNLTPKQVAKNVWCFFGKLEVPSKTNGGFMSNSCYIKTARHYVLVDSGASFLFAKQAYEAMQKVANLPVKHVINTHNHDDHWLGNSFYKKRFNASILAPESMKEVHKNTQVERMFFLLPKAFMKETEVVAVDELITKKKVLDVDGVSILLMPLSFKAHTKSDLFVFLPESKTLFSGDLVMNGRITSNRDGSVIGQLRAFGLMQEQGFVNLVPGHGLNTSIDAMQESRAYFTKLKREVLRAIEEEVEAQSISKYVSLDAFRSKAMYAELHKRNVFDAYQELEFYEE